MYDNAKRKVDTRFLNNPTGEEIWLHIDARFTPMNHRFICILGNRFPADDSKMGGGEEIDYYEETTTVEWSTFMHELGHVLGLHGGDEVIGAGYFPGIDNGSYSFDDYPSVMNYNAPDDYYQYSDGSEGASDHNDWEDIKSEMDDYL